MVARCEVVYDDESSDSDGRNGVGSGGGGDGGVIIRRRIVLVGLFEQALDVCRKG